MTHQRAVNTLAAERYLLDEMSEIERMAFEAHVFECVDCGVDVRTGELMRAATIAQHVGAPFASKSAPGPSPTHFSRWSATIVPWAAAAAIALFAGYQSLFVVPALRRDRLPLALDAVTLRPASRGAEAVVRIRSGQTEVLLDLDVNGAASGPEIEYDLKADDGSAPLVERARTPAPGSPLLLLMPAHRLQSAHQFTIVVRDPSKPESPLGEYRFTVASDGDS